MTQAQSARTAPAASPELAARLQHGLDLVDTRLHSVVEHEDPFIAQASGHLAAAGGKLYRPLLTLLAAELGSGVDDRVVDAATGVELTHLASLYHDDVMDGADVRRGIPSVNAEYGNSTAILVGDLLFGKASELVAGLGAEAVRIQARTFVRLCSGQIRDAMPPPEGVDPVNYYLQVLADKTGALFATAAQYGAMFSGCPPQVVEIARRYGERLGTAFQLADDLIDIASESEVSGKVPGTDLREGVWTLPVLYARAEVRPDDARLHELLGSDLGDDDRLAETLTLLRAHPALEQARRYTESVARDARQLLDPLGDGPVVTALGALALEVADRVA